MQWFKGTSDANHGALEKNVAFLLINHIISASFLILNNLTSQQFNGIFKKNAS